MREQGLEPWTHGLKGRKPRTEATQLQDVTSDGASACTNACTDSPDSGHSDAAEPAGEQTIGERFAEAIVMLERLPLSDEERAEAIRRLLKGESDE